MQDTPSETEISFIDVGAPAAERRIAMRVRHPEKPSEQPTLVWLGGYRSDMTGTKAVEVERYAMERGAACVRFDYSGHGSSGGAFTDGTISRWLEEPCRH